MLPFYPVHALDTRHQAKVLQVVCYHRQAIMEGRGTYEHVELADFAVKVSPNPFQSTTNLAIFFKHIADIVNRHIAPECLRLFDMTVVVTAVDGTIREFRKRYLGSTDLICIFSPTPPPSGRGGNSIQVHVSRRYFSISHPS